jgi:hypothetical protein
LAAVTLTHAGGGRVDQPGFGQQHGFPSGPPPEPIEAWAQRNGWRIARNVPKNVLKQLPGPPFHEFRSKAVPLVLAGQHRGMPAMVLQLDYGAKYSSPTGSYYSSSTGSHVTTWQTNKRISSRVVAILELSAPVPELVVGRKRNVLDDIEDLFKLNRTSMIFQGKPVDVVQVGDPRTSLDAFTFHVSGSSPEYVRSIVSAERIRWLCDAFAGFAATHHCGRPFFRLSGRKIVFWTGGKLASPGVAEGLLDWAHGVTGWIPSAAYQNPAAAEAERQHVPLAQLAIPFTG